MSDDTIVTLNPKHYIGKPCVKCGGVVRYISKKRCVVCTVSSNSLRNAANPEVGRIASAKWAAANPEKVLANSVAWAAANPDKKKAIYKSWAAAHPGDSGARARKHRAIQFAATPDWADFSIINAYYAEAAALTKLSGKPYHVDHILALVNGGGHHQRNLRVIPGVDNLRKRASLNLIDLARPVLPPGAVLAEYAASLADRRMVA